jgi:hypothetical protein
MSYPVGPMSDDERREVRERLDQYTAEPQQRLPRGVQFFAGFTLALGVGLLCVGVYALIALGLP